MKRVVAVLLAGLLIVVGFAGCGNKGTKTADLAAMAEAGVPAELYMDDAVEFNINETIINFNVKEKFETVKEYYDAYLVDNKAVEEFSYDTEAMVSQEGYPEEYMARGFEIWSYQGKLEDETPLYISISELPAGISTYIRVIVAYNESPFETIDTGQEFSITPDMIGPDGEVTLTEDQLNAITAGQGAEEEEPTPTPEETPAETPAESPTA